MLLPKHIASLANHHIEICSAPRHGDSSCVTGGIDTEIGIIDNVSPVEGIFTSFGTCQLFLDFSDQIVRQDYPSVCVQGLYRPCKCSGLQIKLIDEQ